ncbi:CPBP family intramembrane metalloprotease [Carboxylicivirga linearis]|uniref:CPBP family intramembrane metalloprotease n=1 Tax=Carboxylicivirga linearis TaxID=1628157 RepID=A0ABS5K0Q4_9BACT|nr:CPBP family intramembrane metalloprotease [Carboxylicivirga linearis]MBS2100731.1 CPBP family intramembrane metalloprotease [Carboxylicivirga linearis]
MKNWTQKNFVLIVLLLTAILKYLLIDWLNVRTIYIVGISFFWIGYILFRKRTNKEFEIFKLQDFKQSLLILLPIILLNGSACVFYAYTNNTLNVSWHILLVLLLYPFWGVIQQFIMLDIILMNLIAFFKGKVSAILLVFIVSILFGIIHYPNTFLMLYTFFLELILASVFLKWRNLWAIGITHGWMATFLLYYVMDRNLWSEIFIGI